MIFSLLIGTTCIDNDTPASSHLDAQQLQSWIDKKPPFIPNTSDSDSNKVYAFRQLNLEGATDLVNTTDNQAIIYDEKQDPVIL